MVQLAHARACTYIFDYYLLIRTSVACAVAPGGGGGGRQNMRVPPQPINSHHATGGTCFYQRCVSTNFLKWCSKLLKSPFLLAIPRILIHRKGRMER